jgi:hypothetical protein
MSLLRKAIGPVVLQRACARRRRAASAPYFGFFVPAHAKAELSVRFCSSTVSS